MAKDFLKKILLLFWGVYSGWDSKKTVKNVAPVEQVPTRSFNEGGSFVSPDTVAESAEIKKNDWVRVTFKEAQDYMLAHEDEVVLCAAYFPEKNKKERDSMWGLLELFISPKAVNWMMILTDRPEGEDINNFALESLEQKIERKVFVESASAFYFFGKFEVKNLNEKEKKMLNKALIDNKALQGVPVWINPLSQQKNNSNNN